MPLGGYRPGEGVGRPGRPLVGPRPSWPGGFLFISVLSSLLSFLFAFISLILYSFTKIKPTPKMELQFQLLFKKSFTVNKIVKYFIKFKRHLFNCFSYCFIHFSLNI